MVNFLKERNKKNRGYGSNWRAKLAEKQDKRARVRVPKREVDEKPEYVKRCYECDSADHLSFDCPIKKAKLKAPEPKKDKRERKDPKHGKRDKSQKRLKGNKVKKLPWMRETGSGISNSDSDYRSEMVTDPLNCLHVNNSQTRKFCLDGESNCVIVVSDDFSGHQLVPVEGRTLGTAADGAGLAVEACGQIGIFPNVFHCPNGSNNILAEWDLVD